MSLREWNRRQIAAPALREQMQEVLGAKLQAKKVELERRLQILNQQSSSGEPAKLRLPQARNSRSAGRDDFWICTLPLRAAVSADSIATLSF